MAPHQESSTNLTVYKLDHEGREVWRYPARIIQRDNGHVQLEAFFNRDDMDLGYAVFKRGDRFVESFYSDRWYNIFAVYDRDDGALKGWYCNIARPADLGEAAVRCEDLALDVWVDPDGRTTVLDEDEFADLPLSPAERLEAIQGLETLLDLARQGVLPQ